jgi:hypothetical protein
MIQGFHATQDLTDLGRGEDDGEFELGGGAGEVDLGGPGTLEGFFPEEFDGADRLGGRLTREPAPGLEVEEVEAEFFGGDEVGGFGEVLTELTDTGPVRLLGTGLEGEEPKVVGEAIQDCVERDFFLFMGRSVRFGTWRSGGHERPSFRPQAEASARRWE